jgi:hypothetical protein
MVFKKLWKLIKNRHQKWGLFWSFSKLVEFRAKNGLEA